MAKRQAPFADSNFVERKHFHDLHLLFYVEAGNLLELSYHFHPLNRIYLMSYSIRRLTKHLEWQAVS